ncbi:MAG: hypothetical protein ACI906_001320 [Candidatus Latescibacterota bacterium]|jgi:hypothetical protein
MTTTLIAAFVAFSSVMVAMAVGVIFSDRRLKGSCGGLSSMSDNFGQPMCECGAKPGSCSEEEEPLEAAVASH